MRAGSGLVTVGVPKGLNTAAQKKVANVLMTLPLAETHTHAVSSSAWTAIRRFYAKADVLAIGPGMGRQATTQTLIRKVIGTSPKPLVIDADALNALAGHCAVLTTTTTPKILTPHPGEMARLMRTTHQRVEKDRRKVALDFARRYKCTVVLKGHRTVVAEAGRAVYINKTGNAGMATAGSGDVLTGMIAALLAQGLEEFNAAKWGVYLHGMAGDLAAKRKTRAAMIASDIIEMIPSAFKRFT